MSLLLGLFTFLLVIISLFMVLVILAQRAKSDGGVGAALGGGMAEAAFGAESGNVLTKATTWAAVAFFVISFGLYLGHLHQHRVAKSEQQNALPAVPVLSTPAGEAPLVLPEPATPAPAVETTPAASESTTAPEATGTAPSP